MEPRGGARVDGGGGVGMVLVQVPWSADGSTSPPNPPGTVPIVIIYDDDGSISTW